MSKPIVVLADLDFRYLAPLELKLVEELYDKIELEVITDKEFFNEYFSIPRTIEILIISEDLYGLSMQRHNILNMFVLSENMDTGKTEDLSFNKIFKYSSTKEIFNEIMHTSHSDLLEEKQASNETQVIMVYSAIGGAGKTTVALGVSACLTQNHKKVLYIDAEYLQNFQNFLSNKVFLPNDMYRDLRSENEKIYFNIKQAIRNEEFDYIPPFCAAIPALNIKYSMYANLIVKVKESKDYDYIVVDLDSVFNDEKAELLSLANKVLIIVKQDSYSVFKTKILLNNIDCKDSDKYIFLCNAFKNDKKNAILQENEKIEINQYIGFINDVSTLTIDNMLKIEEFQKIAYMLY